jgi:hypothetical protein
MRKVGAEIWTVTEGRMKQVKIFDEVYNVFPETKRISIRRK